MKKLLTIIALLLVATMLFSACGGAAETKADGEGTSAANTTESASKELSGELVYWSMWNETEPQAQVIQEAIDQFTQENPDVSVNVQWNGREIRKTLKPALDAGEVIDIWDEDSERVVKNYQEDSLKLDDFITKPYATTDGKPYQEVVMGTLIDLARGYSTDNGLYAIPYQPYMFNIMYNKDHFKTAGITSVPKTWDEFMDACAKLKAAGFTPITCDDAYIDMMAGYHLSRTLGEKAVEELVTDKTGAKWDDPKVLKAAKEIEALAVNGYISSQIATNKYPAGQQEVAIGKVSMYLNGTWLVNEIMGTTGPEFNWGQFAYPTVTDGVDGLDAANYGAQAFQINKNCKAPEAAFNLIVYLTTGEWDKTLAEKTYGIPMSGGNEWPSQLQDAKEVFSTLKVCYPWSAGVAADTDKFTIITGNYTKLLAGQITAEEFVANCKANKV